MLSLVRHELGHAVGFTRWYDNFSDGLLLLGAPNSRWVYPFAGPPAVGPANQYKPGVPPNFPNGAVYMREWEAAYSGPGARPSHTDEAPGAPPAVGNGPLAGFFPDDLMNGGQLLRERTMISDVNLDILADVYGYTVVPEPTTLALLALGGLAMAGGAARRRLRA